MTQEAFEKAKENAEDLKKINEIKKLIVDQVRINNRRIEVLEEEIMRRRSEVLLLRANNAEGKRDYETLERERITRTKTRFDLTQEEQKEIIQLLQEGGLL